MKQQLYRILGDNEPVKNGDFCIQGYVRPVTAPHWVAFSERMPTNNDYRSFGNDKELLVLDKDMGLYGMSHEKPEHTMTHWLCDLYPPDKPTATVDAGFEKWYAEHKNTFPCRDQAEACYADAIAAAKAATSPV